LFANPRTGDFYSRKTIQNIWQSACKTAGVKYVPPNQALRHSTLSEIAPLIGLVATQSLSGHADVNVLFRHYIATNAETKRAAIEARAQVIEQLANNLPTRSERNNQS
jgi:integrase